MEWRFETASNRWVLESADGDHRGAVSFIEGWTQTSVQGREIPDHWSWSAFSPGYWASRYWKSEDGVHEDVEQAKADALAAAQRLESAALAAGE